MIPNQIPNSNYPGISQKNSTTAQDVVGFVAPDMFGREWYQIPGTHYLTKNVRSLPKEVFGFVEGAALPALPAYTGVQ